MFYDELKKREESYRFLFNLKLVHEIQKNKIDPFASKVLTNDDFIIIKLRSRDDDSCPTDIYLGINKSRNYYSIYLNEKANVYNYEMFDDYKAFEDELYYFLSSPIEEEIISDKNGDKIYADYNVPAKNGKTPFSFRRYYNKTWTNFLGLKKNKKEIRNYSPWL